MTDRLHDRLTVLADQAAVPPLDVAALTAAARARRRRRRVMAAVPALLLALAVPVAVELDRAAGVKDDRLAPDVAAEPPTPVRQVTPALRHVVQFQGIPFDDVRAEFDAPTVTVGKDIPPGLDPRSFSSVAVAFDPAGVESNCIAAAALQMPPALVTGTPEIRAYPSAALSLADGKLPPSGNGAPTTLIDNRPYGQTGEDGSGRYDVTELVQLWTDGGPFPSLGKTVPEGSPIVMLLRPPAHDAGTYSATYDVAGTPPRLTVTLADGCAAEPDAEPGALSDWDPAGTAIAVPHGWTMYSETHENIPPIGSERARMHSWRYAADPNRPAAAAIELTVVDGVPPLADLRTLRGTERDARVLPTSRQQQVILLREQARRSGLTIASWDERPGLQVSVVARGDVDLDTLRTAVNSVVVAP